MENHHTHIVFEFMSSRRNKYKGDENGNIKIDINDDKAYTIHILKKGKISIKQVIINNNNLAKKNLMKDWDIKKKCLKR